MKKTILKLVEKSGPDSYSLISQENMVYDYSFREYCMKNSCGMYGRCWMCPPDTGDVNDLMKKAKSYKYGVLYNTVFGLEDSYDFEGMLEGKRRFNSVAGAITRELRRIDGDTLHLGVGGCGICERCARLDNEPCRHTDIAIASMESYGIFVSETAKRAGLKYINGTNTVTYFGIVLFDNMITGQGRLL